MNKIENKEDLIYNLVHMAYRRHDLSTTFYKESIERIVKLCMKEIKKYPDIPITKYFITQIILENF